MITDDHTDQPGTMPADLGRLLAIYRATRQMVRENRRFLVRALDYVLAQGISQYLDLGAGLPTRPAVHDIVRRYDTTAPVLDVDSDPVVISHLRALSCSGDPRVHAIPADLAGPAAVLAQAHQAGEIDFTEPGSLMRGPGSRAGGPRPRSGTGPGRSWPAWASSYDQR